MEFGAEFVVGITVALAVVGAHSILARIRAGAPDESRLPQDWHDLEESLDLTAALYQGYRQERVTMSTLGALQRWARRRPTVLQMATETCDTLGVSTFVQLSNRHILRFDAPLATDPDDPTHEVDHPELLLTSPTRLVAARRRDRTIEADFAHDGRVFTLRSSGAAILR